MNFIHDIEHTVGGWVHTGTNLVREGSYYAQTGIRMAYRAVVPGAKDDVQLSPHAQSILDSEHVSNAEQLHNPSDRAGVAWDALKTNMDSSTGLLDKRSGQPASAWTYGQTMVAALDAGDTQQFDKLADGLKKYQSPTGGYCPGTNGVSGTGNRYYDDNAWIGLAFMQGYHQTSDPSKKAEYLKNAEGVFNFLKTGQHANGGLQWEENQPGGGSFNTCTQGPAMELALRLHMATAQNPHDTHDQYFQFASQLDNYTNNNLRIKDGPNAGMYIDHVNPDGSKGDGLLTYNQGTPIGANLLFYHITGDKSYLTQAQQTANASLNYFGQDKLMDSAPAFNAIYFRNLEQLNNVAPDPRIGAALSTYNNQVWNDGLNPQSGLFDRPSDLGHYGSAPGDTLDQAGLVQLFALQARSPQLLGAVT